MIGRKEGEDEACRPGGAGESVRALPEIDCGETISLSARLHGHARSSKQAGKQGRTNTLDDHLNCMLNIVSADRL